MPSALIYTFGTVTGIGLVLIVLICMRKAAEYARQEQRKEHARIQAEKDAAFNRGYDRAIRDCRRYDNRRAAEQFADTFENHRTKFQMREAQ